MDPKKIYTFGKVSLYKIRNRNEVRVIKLLGEVLREYPDYSPEPLDIEDIYALALNKLPAHYVQAGSIVLQDPIDDTTIRDALRHAIQSVRQRPNYLKSFQNLVSGLRARRKPMKKRSIHGSM